MISLWDEQSFWLEMLQDHAYFVRDGLSVNETEYVEVAQQFIVLYGDLLRKLQSIPRHAGYQDSQMIDFSRKAWKVAKSYYDFEGTLQSLRIDNKVNLSLSPTYLNGTLSENQEYLRILSYLVQGQEPVRLSATQVMDLWLEDQLGHAVLFENLLDPIEVGANTVAQEFKLRFQLYIVQNHHLKNYLRVKQPGFARQQEFIYEVGKTTLEMNQFIKNMVEKYKGDTLLNKSNLRFLEHHFPETCYFLASLSFYEPRLQAEVGNCTLSKPSF
ncbi:hypothetical protein G3A_05755 [Bacillus sp. 17376]|uniref:DUF2935 domain-containing protein n=1 Tax=Mesobacillus boroniphilus JCM 21738 TaxID=1294265 RepID=W4RSK0_9BACI|nr:DUF2935 domain-containing protein [Mesobacillus boroniphilus]ESU33515.1 hypothetical protein G3A_05755 [Bacillus sp. 17376]GAE47395.1 hypothetical protein JCM21738_4373 [Mesobacillus boroniphilus JCM 21738]